MRMVMVQWTTGSSLRPSASCRSLRTWKRNPRQWVTEARQLTGSTKIQAKIAIVMREVLPCLCRKLPGDPTRIGLPGLIGRMGLPHEAVVMPVPLHDAVRCGIHVEVGLLHIDMKAR